MTKEELEKQIDELNERVNEIWHESFDRPDGWNWYRNHPDLKKLIDLEREYKLVQDYTLSDLDDFGDHMTMGKFVSACKHKLFVDSDGDGVYATADKQSDIWVHPGDIISGKYRKDFTHVMWYNK